jgi:hypothetical protein
LPSSIHSHGMQFPGVTFGLHVKARESPIDFEMKRSSGLRRARNTIEDRTSK